MKTVKAVKAVGSVLGVVAVLTLGACATVNDPPSGATSTPSSQGVTLGYGTVQSIEIVPPDPGGIGGSGIGLGAIAGAVVGGLAGSQVGSGSGTTAATVVGAAGGAYVGHEIENRQKAHEDTYRITVRMNDGAYQALTHTTAADLRVGDRVRVGHGGVVHRY
jgi:outer membrane lipoprotein SlyB